MDKKLASQLNEQINVELQSAYAYFAMAAHSDSKSLDGFANWFNVQAQEELQHALKIYRFLTDRGVSAKMLALSQPKNEFKNLTDLFNYSLAKEQELADRFDKLSALALKTKDNATVVFLQWFINEQVEEIAQCKHILDKLKLIGDNGYGILMLDTELGTRTLTPAAESA